MGNGDSLFHSDHGSHPHIIVSSVGESPNPDGSPGLWAWDFLGENTQFWDFEGFIGILVMEIAGKFEIHAGVGIRKRKAKDFGEKFLKSNFIQIKYTL